MVMATRQTARRRRRRCPSKARQPIQLAIQAAQGDFTRHRARACSWQVADAEHKKLKTSGEASGRTDGEDGACGNKRPAAATSGCGFCDFLDDSNLQLVPFFGDAAAADVCRVIQQLVSGGLRVQADTP